MAAGLVTAFSRPAGRIGDLAVLAGLVWFAPVWVGWDKGPPLVRSLGMLAAGFTFPLLLHLVLAYPSGRLHGTAARTLVAAVYLEAVVVALGRALFRDPFFDPNCWANCTDNAFLVRSLPQLARAIEVADRWFTAAAAAALVAVCAWRLLRDSGPARRALLPVALPAILLAGAVTAHAVALQRRPLEDPSDPAFRTIFALGAPRSSCSPPGWCGPQSAPGSSAAPWPGSRPTWDKRPRRGRCRRPSPRPSAILSSRSPTGCPTPSTMWTPPAGRSPSRPPHPAARSPPWFATAARSRSSPTPQRSPTWSASSAPPSGWRWRTSGCRPRRWPSSTSCAPPGSASWRPATANAAGWNATCTTAPSSACWPSPTTSGSPAPKPRPTATRRTGSLLTQATDQAQAALDELRELAHGIYPAILAEAGLTAALATLADAAPLPVELRDAAEGRYPAAVETAAYLLVAEALQDAAGRDASHATVSVARDGGRLVVTVEDDGTDRTSSMVQLADRVGALDGRLAVEPTRLQAELPCG